MTIFGARLLELICRRKWKADYQRKSGCHREVPASQFNDRRILSKVAKYTILNLRILNKHTCPFYVSGSFWGKRLSYPALRYRATNILDKTQGSFQKGVILFKSVIKASLIRLLIAACFFVVTRRGKNINWPLITLPYVWSRLY